MSSLKENSFCKTEEENLLIYSLTINEKYKKAERKVKECLSPPKVKILICMFIRSHEVWFGFAEKKFIFCLPKSRKLVFFSEDDCHPTLYSFANNGWSLWLLEKTWQQAVVFVSNKFMSSFVMSCYCKINFLDSVIVQK